VLRYWETEFSQWLRLERSQRGRRIYTRRQALTVGVIRELLYTELYTVAGAKRQLRLAAEREKQAG
jgi:DNA-binding transcriptional MerR regulator